MGSLELSDLPQDMTKEEKEEVLAFITNGCPGVLRINHSDVFKYFELYMSGKTYAEIAVIIKAPKDLIMYLAYRSRWMEHRFKHYEDISLNLLDKLQKAKLDMANNLLTIIAAKGKYLSAEYNRYLSTNDKSVIESIDTKMDASYNKSIEMLNKILNAEDNDDPNKKPQQPLVNINMGLGAKATVQQVGDQTFEITDDTAGEMLKALASLKKDAERK